MVDDASVSDLDPGHTCISIPNPPSRIVAGANATLQAIYTADWDAPHNQTFYACADITYVERADFQTRVPCFNATEPGEDDTDSRPSPNPKHDGDDDHDGKGSSLSGGAIAGVVIGTVAGVAMIAAVALLVYRRQQQAKRSKKLALMEENARSWQ